MADNALAYFQIGAQMGERLRQRREERKTKSALAAYAVNPTDAKAFSDLAAVNPEMAIRVGETQQKRALEVKAQDLTRRAASGDKGAAAELAGIDINAWDKLHDNERQNLGRQVDYIGQAALAVSRLPEDQRSGAWDQYVAQGVQQGFAGLSDYQGKYSPEALNAAIASAGKVSEFIKLSEPQYQVVPEGGALVNTNDPAAITSYVEGQAAASSASKEIGGKTYYNVGGKWYDQPPTQGGGGTSATSNFP